MLSTLAFLAAIGLFCYIVLWCIRNDGAARPEDQAGLLCMRGGGDLEPPQAQSGKTTRKERRGPRPAAETTSSAAAANKRPAK